MLIYYGSFMYFAYILLAIGGFLGAFFALRNRSERTKRLTVIIIASVNLAQHLLKGLIYPHYWGGNYSLNLSSAYNVCALLIIASPFVWAFGCKLLKNYLTYIGTIAGMIAMLVPYWFIGQSAFQSEAYRFYLCHSLLFISSLLPVFLGLVKLEWKHFWKIGLLFFSMLGIIIINDIFFIAIGHYPVSNPSDIYGSLCEINPCWSITAPSGFDWLVKIISAFTPAFLRGGNSAGFYVPILWYAIPMYLGITLVAFVVCVLCDLGTFKAYLSNIKENISKKRNN